VPKKKTNRSAVKRFSRTGSGKLKRRQAHTTHLLTKKTRKRKRYLGRSDLVARSDAGRVTAMING